MTKLLKYVVDFNNLIHLLLYIHLINMLIFIIHSISLVDSICSTIFNHHIEVKLERMSTIIYLYVTS